MDNPQDGKLTVFFDDTDAKIGRWHGWQFEPLATVHNMPNPPDALQAFAALKIRLMEIVDLIAEETCPERLVDHAPGCGLSHYATQAQRTPCDCGFAEQDRR